MMTNPPITCRAWAGTAVDVDHVASVHGDAVSPTVSPSHEAYHAAGLVKARVGPGWVSARLYDSVKPWFWLGAQA